MSMHTSSPAASARVLTQPTCSNSVLAVVQLQPQAFLRHRSSSQSLSGAVPSLSGSSRVSCDISAEFSATHMSHRVSGDQVSIYSSYRCTRAIMECAYSRSYADIDVVASDTKKVAGDVGKGTSLVVFYSDHHNMPVTTTENVPLDKCRATRVLLQNDTSFQNLFTTIPAPLVASEELCLVYDERYIQGILDEDWNANKLQPFGFPWSRELVTRSCASTGGAVAAMHVVMLGLRLVAASIGGDGISSHMEGSALVPSGVFNDVAVAASVALQSYPKVCNKNRPILVIDLDVCQRTDTIRVFEKENRVVTFNLHGSNNAPWRKDKQRDTDSGLLDCTGDDYYLAVLADRLQQLFDFCNPSLVFFQAGVDALSEDTSGKLSMTRQGLIHRNNIVYTACFTRKVPLVITMGAGYSKPLEACIEAHADVYRTAALRYGTVPQKPEI